MINEDLIYECAKIILNKHLDVPTDTKDKVVEIIKQAAIENTPVEVSTTDSKKLMEDDIIGQYGELSDIQAFKNITRKPIINQKRKDHSKITDDHLYEMDGLLRTLQLSDVMRKMNGKYGWSKVLSTYSLMTNRKKAYLHRAPRFTDSLKLAQ
jgi:hypothetical protein